jgi:hypothetical protein
MTGTSVTSSDALSAIKVRKIGTFPESTAKSIGKRMLKAKPHTIKDNAVD